MYYQKKRKYFSKKIARNHFFVIGIFCFLLNSVIYIFPSEVATPPVKFIDALLFYSALHSLFFCGIMFIAISYLINREIKNGLAKDEMNFMIDSIYSYHTITIN